MSEVRKGWHCAWQIHYHLVFPVKYRKALLNTDVITVIQKTTEEISERYEIEFEQLGMDQDHIHILCSTHPKTAPGKIVQIYKSITARELFKQKPELKKELWGGEFWSDGYYVATVGERGDWSIVERYVKNQGKLPHELKQLTLFS